MKPRIAAQLRIIREAGRARRQEYSVVALRRMRTRRADRRDHSRPRGCRVWVSRHDGNHVRDALVASGFVVLDTQPPEESREFMRDEVVVSSAFFDARANGTFGVQSRWSDWVFPIGSFDTPPGRLGDLVVPAMSIEGMLAMKEQY